ncbi:MAG: extracellular solute-binding protein [Clostridiales bacterium]|nr:extracellular solute-binding protein [Clostridiales bacterium]
MKILHRFGIIALICAILTGCSSTPNNADNPPPNLSDDSSSSPETTELKPDLPDVKYDGYEFTIAFRDLNNYIDDIAWYDEATGDVINDAKYKRNREIEEKYDIKINPIIIAGDNTAGSLTASIMANDAAYDLIAPHAHIAWGTYIAEGLTLSWSDNLTYCNFDMPWWDQNSRQSLSVEGRIYTMAGDFSYFEFGSARAVVFNKRILENLNEDMPYQKVYDGDWTFDEFERLCMLAVNDLNGDSIYNLNDDQYGYATNWWGGPVTLFFGAGGVSTLKDSNDLPYIALNSERSNTIFERFFKMMSNEGMHIEMATNTTVDLNSFIDGHALFTDMNLVDLVKLREMRDDWGVLPIPKLDSEQETYYSSVDAGVHLYIVPIDTVDVDRTSIIMEAMSYGGYKDVIPAFYDVSLQNKYSRDDESAEMLDIIKNNRVFDFGYFTNYSHNIGCAGHYLCRSNDPNLVSYCATYVPPAEEALANFVEKIKESN